MTYSTGDQLTDVILKATHAPPWTAFQVSKARDAADAIRAAGLLATQGRLAAELSKLRAENEKLRDVVAEYDRHAPACLKERQRLRAENAKQSSRVIGEVIGERVRQDERWGEQNHPFISGSTIGEADAIRAEYLTRADAWRRLCDERAGLGVPSWDAVLLEEVYEALSEEDPIKREEELIQVAAVAVSMVECSRRQRAAEGRPAGGEETDQWKWRSGQ